MAKMRNAINCAPRKCTCGRKLGKPEYDFAWPKPFGKFHPNVFVSRWDVPIREKVWHIKCECGLRHIWSYPNEYVVRSDMPLFDSEVITTRKGT